MEVGIEENLEKINFQKMLLKAVTDTQVCLQLMVEKGLVTREEIATMRSKVNNSDKYKPLWEILEQRQKKFNEYSSNPKQYLKDMLNAKLQGKM